MSILALFIKGGYNMAVILEKIESMNLDGILSLLSMTSERWHYRYYTQFTLFALLVTIKYNEY